jgi:hypothetical protein
VGDLAPQLARGGAACLRILAARRGIADLEAVDRSTALALYDAAIEAVERYVAHDVADGDEAVDWRATRRRRRR